MNEPTPRLISIVGPTAVGKTAKAIEIARLLNTEIISADSRQFYREMTIGTAKPTKAELAQVHHHFIDSHAITDFYSAGAFERDCLDLIQELGKKYADVVMTGGSGLYLKAIWEGFDDMPEISELVRQKLNSELKTHGLDTLLKELEKKDPEYFLKVDQKNHQRIIRALEVIRTTGQPFSSYRIKKPIAERPFQLVKIGLELEREKLYERIDQRMNKMIADGLFDEGHKLYKHRHLNALQTVGYKEIFDYMEGQYDYQEAVRLLKRNSRRYAKRQLTWFKADPEINWFDATTSANDILVSLQLK